MKRKYEIGFIMHPETSEEDVKKMIDSVSDIVVKASGTVENVDEWGRKKFAYPIKRQNEGIYVFMNADVAGTAHIEIERRLKLTEKVLRFIVLRLDDKLKKGNRLTKKWKKIEKLSRKSTASEAGEEKIREEFSESKVVNDETK